jgi:hypothetical protein
VERRSGRLRSVSVRRVMPCFARAKAADCPIPGKGCEDILRESKVVGWNYLMLHLLGMLFLLTRSPLSRSMI